MTTRPAFCPNCGKPLKADLIFPFSIGPKDYADGGYTVICSEGDGPDAVFCWQGDVYPEDEKRGCYSTEEAADKFQLAVSREEGRLDKLMDTLSMYRIECDERTDAHFDAMSDDEIRSFMARCDKSQESCVGFEAPAMEFKKRARIVLGMRRHLLRARELGAEQYCLYHACDLKDCIKQHGLDDEVNTDDEADTDDDARSQ